MIERTDYREWMKSELLRRMENNRRYSLRAFARDLQLSPASVSLILNGRKGLSRVSAERVARLMGLNPEEQEHFLFLARPKRRNGTMTATPFRLSAPLAIAPGSRATVTGRFEGIREELVRDFSVSQNPEDQKYILFVELKPIP